MSQQFADLLLADFKQSFLVHPWIDQRSRVVTITRFQINKRGLIGSSVMLFDGIVFLVQNLFKGRIIYVGTQ
jgi:hypothetical protein